VLQHYLVTVNLARIFKSCYPFLFTLAVLGIPDPVSISQDAFKASQLIKAPLLQSVQNDASATIAPAAQKE
jgi:hypothetical protein